MNDLDDLHLSFEIGVVIPFHVPGGGLLVFVVSWLTVKVREGAKLHTDQTVGSSVTNASLPASGHGVGGNLDLLSLSFPSGLGVIGGVESLSTGSPSGRGSGYLGLMHSQASVGSYTKDRAGLQGDHTPKGRGYKVKNRNSSRGNLCRPHWTQVVAHQCLSVLCGGKVPPQGAPQEGAQRYQAAKLSAAPHCQIAGRCCRHFR